MTEKPIIAAFDFDGTLTYRDSLLPFLFFTHSRLETLKKLFILLPQFAEFELGLVTRQAIKEAILTRFFEGDSIEKVAELGRAFAEQILDSKIRPKGAEKIQWHLAQGHRCVLVSANLEIYLRPWALAHGFSDIVASELELTQNKRITGQLAGKNCWGPEKTKRLEQLLGPKEGYVLYAYGDSRGDQELLELADYPFYRTF
ncbi:HAD family hydrolase [Parachlamydia acanthamoebae]|uniref:HAD family hydrolase n=1 Tax=Parachlamydia acanthamoebae TaxID=83552 RepID=UPI0007519523|nr:HAD family hydrolase [Parachlamydia acanthamoebae]